MKKFFLSLFALFYTQLIHCSGLDDEINRAIVIVIITPITYLLTLAVIQGVRLGYWNEYLSKIRWPKRLFDCGHDEERTLLVIIVLATILVGKLVPVPFQLGIVLAFITLLVAYMFYRMRHSASRCAFSIVVYSFTILGLLYYIYKLFMRI